VDSSKKEEKEQVKYGIEFSCINSFIVLYHLFTVISVFQFNGGKESVKGNNKRA
jgi:hypothetical protein